MIKPFTLRLFILISLLISSVPGHTRDFGCVEKDISDYQWRVRHDAALPAVLDASPNEEIQGCVVVTGVGKFPLILEDMKNVNILINEEAYDSDNNHMVKDGDKLSFKFRAPSKFNSNQVVRLTFNETDQERRRKVYRIIWSIQTLNVEREPRTWLIGPSYPYREVSDVLPDVVAGDTLFLEANATYEPFDIRYVPGTKNLPITLKGNTNAAKDRPIVAGGSEKYNWTVSLRGSHYWIIENIIIQDGGLCFRNESNGTTIKNVLIQRCSTGILGTDLNSGNLTILNSEVRESGGKALGRSWGHAIYAASDQHSFPNSLLTIKNSFIHNNRGNSIKSRFQNTLIEGNWIESGDHPQAKYLIELIGYDGKFDFYGQQNTVFNNILLHQPPGLGSRVGGDGNSASRGDTLFRDNLFLLAPNFNRTLVRTFQGLRSLTLSGNTVAFISKPKSIVLVTDELQNREWVEGKPNITIKENTLNERTELLKRIHADVSDTNVESIILKRNTFIEPIIIEYNEIRRRRPIINSYIEGIEG
ncbi:right-handed parallel beta-helix repeat-containing protein [Alteromonas sp. MMG017]|uniref:right-handed parallel beta-helix repeat-containing protein n=1 Tax=Alteromonas sp. MMG017 TaxID=2822692 RepID=UPI001B3A0B69|nr:right-handed parallel beta-helix repeat-containing protein [Alteromonas sp. MMG017]MBQ4829546.1 right-handed parallel beta-helix repeat-containing protein [Alteromonas sp. MMG017]